MKIKDRIKHAWNAFTEDKRSIGMDYGISSSRPTHRNRVTSINTGSYVSSIYNRIAIDVSMTEFRHVKVNNDNDDEETVRSRLNECLSVESNIDQTHLQLIQDIVYSMFDEGVVAVVPVETTLSPEQSGGYDIVSLRVGKILNWFPKHVEVDLYNEDTGQNERIYLKKSYVAIIENPLYSVVNDENSTLKRLIRKLHQLDTVDAITASNRLDLMISVPYGIKTETQRKMAERRIKDIEDQLASGKNGIAYIDGTEKMQQLNRPVNSQLSENIDKLTQEFYNQLGLTQNVFNGTAKEEELRTYNSRTIDPIVSSIVAEFTRKFFTKTARTQGHKIKYYRDMFKLIPIESIANLGDSFKRNEIASSNELRKIIGLRRSNDPRADLLFNPNMPVDKQKNETGGSIIDTGLAERNKERKRLEKKAEEELEEQEIAKHQTHMTNRERKEDKKRRKEESKQ